MRTTALLDFSASASEKVFPSTVVNVKLGAAAPIAGPSARAAPASAMTAARLRAFRSVFIGLLLFSLTGPKFRTPLENSRTARLRSGGAASPAAAGRPRARRFGLRAPGRGARGPAAPGRLPPRRPACFRLPPEGPPHRPGT